MNFNPNLANCVAFKEGAVIVTLYFGFKVKATSAVVFAVAVIVLAKISYSLTPNPEIVYLTADSNFTEYWAVVALTATTGT